MLCKDVAMYIALFSTFHNFAGLTKSSKSLDELLVFNAEVSFLSYLYQQISNRVELSLTLIIGGAMARKVSPLW